MKTNKNKPYFISLALIIILLLVAMLLLNLHAAREKNVQKEPVPIEEVSEPKPEKPKKKPSTEKNKGKTLDDSASENVESAEEESEINDLDSLALELETEQPIQVQDEEPTAELNADSGAVHISRTKSLINNSGISTGNIPANKVYYQSEKGRIESQVRENDKNEFVEYLIAFDASGNKIQELEIGLVDPSGLKRKHAVISHNRISTFTLSQGKSGNPQEIVVEYSITPDLRFTKGKTYVKVL